MGKADVWSLRSRCPSGDVFLDTTDRMRSASGGLLVLYGRLLGLLLAGYLLFDRAFAYLHLPGTPLYVGEMVIVVGVLGVLAETEYLRVPVKDEPILALLAAFLLWGFIRFLPGWRTYGINAVRDFALCYYCLFAFLTIAALKKSPDLIERWVVRLTRFVPWLLMWLPLALVLQTLVRHVPKLPTTSTPILSHAPGNAATAALLALGCLWLFPEGRSARSRAVWSIMALVVLLLSATQNRGGMVGAIAAALVGLAFFPSRDRLRLIMRAVAVIGLVLGLALLLSLKIPAPTAGGQVRDFSASQLIANVASIGGAQEGGKGGLSGTAEGRDQLWSLIFDQQVADARLSYGFGFGTNLAYQVGDYQVTFGSDPLRSPHNSHFDVLARMGLVGLSLWIALWLGWYRRMVAGCRRLARRGLHTRRQVAVLCLMVTTAILVSTFFAPLLEGAQVAALLWTAFGVGVAVTTASERGPAT